MEKERKKRNKKERRNTRKRKKETRGNNFVQTLLYRRPLYTTKEYESNEEEQETPS
jgi:hypothetical protein